MCEPIVRTEASWVQPSAVRLCEPPEGVEEGSPVAAYTTGGESWHGSLDLDRSRRHPGRRVDRYAEPRLAERAGDVVLGAPGGVDVAVHHTGHVFGVFGAGAERVVGGSRVLGEHHGHDAAARVYVGRHTCAAVSVAGQGDERDRDYRGEQNERDDPASRVAHAPRQQAPRRRIECAQNSRDLTRDLTGARCLDRQSPLHVEDHPGHVGIAAVEVLGGGPFDDGRRRGRDFGTRKLHVGYLLAHVHHRHRHGRLAVERNLAGEHLVDDDAQRVHIGLAGDGLAEGLLGRHVVGRAEHAPVHREAFLGQGARDAEVGDLGAALAAQQNVLGLDVAVDDLLCVRCAQGARDLDRVGERHRRFQGGLAPDQVLQGLARDVLEHDVGRSHLDVGVALVRIPLPCIDHRDDVGMVQLSDGARLAPEALQLIGVRRDLAVHQLDRHLSLEHGVERAVDGAHAAVPYARVQAVATAERGAEDEVGHDWSL